MSESAFIDDGYTLAGLVKGQPRLWPQIKFTFRPAMPAAILEHQRLIRDGSGADRAEAETKLICAHLVSWDAQTRDGLAPITPALVAKLRHQVRQILLDHITGYAVPQEDGQPSQLESDVKN